jgi:hypothetical protein
LSYVRRLRVHVEERRDLATERRVRDTRVELCVGIPDAHPTKAQLFKVVLERKVRQVR